ncbi:MAG: hypothetical protein IJG51_05070 [Synergistaceae bacterium]|nr:hypothetical protein [Synergistaceae bacterium]MBQ3398236.1 hypothetical protein [Synergistaceae bacterium]MBQ6114711.1 hypothetical protein [Synergistaceae bacterium]
MKKIAVVVLLSMLFVSDVQGVSFADLPTIESSGAMSSGAVGAVSTTNSIVPLLGGGFRHETETVIDPSMKGGVVGATAGAATGAAIGSFIPVVGTAVGAGVGAVVGGVVGWIFGPAD